jgi:subtilisin family serine protease
MQAAVEANGTGSRVLVLDTGLPSEEDVGKELVADADWINGLRGNSKDPASQLALNAVSVTVSKEDDKSVYWDSDKFDSNDDGRLDPASGHGVFIASIIQRIAPDAKTTVVRVVRRLGLAIESEVLRVLYWAADQQFDIINMSFSAYGVPDDTYRLFSDAVHALRQAGAVVVASAGNEAVWEAPLPASLHGVIAVAALDMQESGPATFTNYGPWVDACAPGTDIEGEFWRRPDGERLWQGRALWSGTSFAAPYVAGAIARTRSTSGLSPQQAAGRLLDDRTRGSIPWHGRVIRGF